MSKLCPAASLSRTALATSAALVLIAAATSLVAHAQEATPPANAPTQAPVQVQAGIIDAKAEALVQRASDRILAAQALSGKVENTTTDLATATTPASKNATKGRFVVTFQMQQPDLMYSEITVQEQSLDGAWTTVAPTAQLISDGTRRVRLVPSDKTYRVLDISKPALLNVYKSGLYNYAGLAPFETKQIGADKASGMLVSLTLAPDAVWGGVPCSVVEKRNRVGKDAPASAFIRFKLYIGKKDGIIRGYHREVSSPSGDKILSMTDCIVTNVAVGEGLPASTFAIDLTGYKEVVMPVVPARQ